MAILIRCKVCNECKPLFRLRRIEFSKGEAVCKECMKDKKAK